MQKIWTLILVAALSLAACIKVSEATPAPTRALFVTATLPPTRPGLFLPTDTPTVTPGPTMAAQTSVTPAETAAASCKDSAILLKDVTIPDNTTVPGGQKFTKTWQFKNMGKCPWKGYTIVFLSGDRMKTPDSASVPDTEAQATVDVSVDLVAPSTDGVFTGVFELRDAAGQAVPVGTEKSFWVKITVGNGAGQASGSGSAYPTINPVLYAHCQYSENAGYVQQLISLINQARAEAQLPTLTVDSQLAAAAQMHSVDMACGNFLSHSGPNGEPIGYRLREIGYASVGFREIIAIGTPQDAMNQWRNDPGHWEYVLFPAGGWIGVGYAYSAASDFGGYFTVDFNSQ